MAKPTLKQRPTRSGARGRKWEIVLVVGWRRQLERSKLRARGHESVRVGEDGAAVGGGERENVQIGGSTQQAARSSSGSSLWLPAAAASQPGS